MTTAATPTTTTTTTPASTTTSMPLTSSAECVHDLVSFRCANGVSEGSLLPLVRTDDVVDDR